MHATARLTGRRPLVGSALLALALALGLSACGDGGDDGADTTTSTDAGGAAQTTTSTATLDKVEDTQETVAAASATTVPADELASQIAAIEQGLADAGFDATNVGQVGEAKADIVVDGSWAVYVYDSERGAAEFALFMQDAGLDEASTALFRIGNRVYYASMTSALSDDDRAKLDEIATAAEGAVAGS